LVAPNLESSQAFDHVKDSKRCLTVFFLLICLTLPAAVVAEMQWVDRPDPMRNHQLLDYDRAGDTVRILYLSQPDLEQSAGPNWTVNVYLAELRPEGSFDNRMLATGQRYFSSAVLQRGGDVIFAMPGTAHGQRSETMEIWSADDGELLNVFSSPSLAGVGGAALTVFPTDDGNFFVVNVSAQSGRGGEPTTLTWYKFSPEGDVLAKGEWSNPTATTGVGGVFLARRGGMGISVNMMLARDMHVLETDFTPVQQFEVGGRSMEARVHSETRLLATDASGALIWISPGLERQLMWDGDMTIPKELPMDQMMAQNAEQMALMSDVNKESGGQRRILHQSTTVYDDIQRSPNGYGMLTQVTADRNLEPPLHGTWYVEIGDDGALRRELRIEPVADQLKGQIQRFTPTEDGGLLVAGSRYQGEATLHVTALDESGQGRWTTSAGRRGTQMEGLTGTAEVPWVFGQGWNDSHGKSLLWVERIDPDSAQPFEVKANTTAAAPVAPQTGPAADSKPGQVPGLEMPEAPEGCECSCEELAAVRKLMEGVKSLPQAEMLAIIQSPDYQLAMSCLGGCAMGYMQCR